MSWCPVCHRRETSTKNGQISFSFLRQPWLVHKTKQGRTLQSCMGRSPHSNLIGSHIESFDIITEQFKLIERNYTVEIHRQCRPQCGAPGSHAIDAELGAARCVSSILEELVRFWGLRLIGQFGVEASHVKRFTSPPSSSVSHFISSVQIKFLSRASAWNEPLSVPSVCRWHTVHTWARSVGSHRGPRRACGNPAISGTLWEFFSSSCLMGNVSSSHKPTEERLQRWLLPPDSSLPSL